MYIFFRIAGHVNLFFFNENKFTAVPNLAYMAYMNQYAQVKIGFEFYSTPLKANITFKYRIEDLKGFIEAKNVTES